MRYIHLPAHLLILSGKILPLMPNVLKCMLERFEHFQGFIFVEVGYGNALLKIPSTDRFVFSHRLKILTYTF